jgi:hypothetical protein
MIATDGRTRATLRPAWRSYRAWRRLEWFAILVAFAVAAYEMFVLRNAALDVAMYAWLFVGTYAMGRVGKFRCPRCHESFHSRTTPAPIGRVNPFARRCLNCGLPKWTDP